MFFSVVRFFLVLMMLANSLYASPQSPQSKVLYSKIVIGETQSGTQYYLKCSLYPEISAAQVRTFSYRVTDKVGDETNKNLTFPYTQQNKEQTLNTMSEMWQNLKRKAQIITNQGNKKPNISYLKLADYVKNYRQFYETVLAINPKKKVTDNTPNKTKSIGAQVYYLIKHFTPKNDQNNTPVSFCLFCDNQPNISVLDQPRDSDLITELNNLCSFEPRIHTDEEVESMVSHPLDYISQGMN